MARPPKKKPDPPRRPCQKFAVVSVDQVGVCFILKIFHIRISFYHVRSFMLQS
jgi:hypothetical protein